MWTHDMKLAFCPKKEALPAWLSYCFMQPDVPALHHVLTPTWLPVTKVWALIMGRLRLESNI